MVTTREDAIQPIPCAETALLTWAKNATQSLSRRLAMLIAQGLAVAIELSIDRQENTAMLVKLPIALIA